MPEACFHRQSPQITSSWWSRTLGSLLRCPTKFDKCTLRNLQLKYNLHYMTAFQTSGTSLAWMSSSSEKTKEKALCGLFFFTLQRDKQHLTVKNCPRLRLWGIFVDKVGNWGCLLFQDQTVRSGSAVQHSSHFPTHRLSLGTLCSSLKCLQVKKKGVKYAYY